MSAVLTFAKLTMWEASRRRLLLALVLMTLAIVLLTGWGYSRLWTIESRGRPIGAVEVHLIASQLLILVSFMFAAVLALSSVLVAAPSLSGDIESGLALSMLSRPVRRAEVAVGKWLGLAALVVAYAAGSGTLELGVLRLTTGYLPPHPFLLMAFIAGEGLVLLTIAMLFSTRMGGMTGGIIALVLYFMAWIGGIVAGIGQALSNAPLIQIGTLSKLLLPTDALWRGAVWAMEPASIQAVARAAGPGASANPFAVSDPTPPALVAWSVFWVLGVLGLALWSFRGREV